MKLQKLFENKWYTLGVLLMAQILIIFDNTGLSISTANIISELNTTLDQVQFSLAMYPMVAGSLMIAGGMLGLVIGWKRLFQIGVGLYVLAELIVATAGSIEILIFGGRVLAGLAGSMIIPAVLGMIPGLYYGKDRVQAFSLVAVAVAIGSAISPFVFAIIIDNYSFKLGFGFMMVMFGLMFTFSFFIKDIPLPDKKIVFDFVGMLLMSTSVFLFMIGLMKIGEWGIWSAHNDETAIMGLSPSPILVLLGFFIFYIFLKWESKVDKKGGDCLLPLEFIESAEVRSGLGFTAVVFMAFVTITFIVISYIQIVGEFSALKTAGMLLFFSIGMIGGSLGAPAWLSRMSAKSVNTLGFIALIVGLVSMYFGLEYAGINTLMPIGMSIFGVGLGIISAQMSLMVTESLSHQGAMQSGGVQATFRGIGEALGVAVLGTTLMLSTTLSIKNAGRSNNEISKKTADLIVEVNTIPFSADKTFKIMLDKHIEDERDKKELMLINTEARKYAAENALVIMIFLVSFFYMLLQRGVRDESILNSS
ncbi:MFS transporter [Hydrogenimonas cancrithermarum]|uniref:Riboflavin transporter RibZ n=1 Tax=Hydrogenimonas cancrithermarum TaxID=2993563 RepID=A0ABN6WYP6_9BACT|nr:MFS transporter [Hydrogenimonas cancrithermarum]BDY13928.1 riboflavin transporter RibZ [Hydrogenimonas cancrithermarum]